MKISRLLLFLAWLIIWSGFTGCSSEKQMTQRRNLMIPQKDELPRNSKYSAVKKRKSNKQKKKKHKKSKRYSCLETRPSDHIYYS
jgi:hypothetical protein